MKSKVFVKLKSCLRVVADVYSKITLLIATQTRERLLFGTTFEKCQSGLRITQIITIDPPDLARSKVHFYLLIIDAS